MRFIITAELLWDDEGRIKSDTEQFVMDELSMDDVIALINDGGSVEAHGEALFAKFAAQLEADTGWGSGLGYTARGWDTIDGLTAFEQFQLEHDGVISCPTPSLHTAG